MKIWPVFTDSSTYIKGNVRMREREAYKKRKNVAQAAEVP